MRDASGAGSRVRRSSLFSGEARSKRPHSCRDRRADGRCADARNRPHAVGPEGDSRSAETCRAIDPFGRGWPMRLRSSEWLLVIYFGYVAVIAPRFPLQQQVVWRPFLAEVLVCGLFLALAYGESRELAKLFSMLRD